MRDGNRARILRLMDGKLTVAEIAKRVRQEQRIVREHMYLMSTLHGIGCEVAESAKVRAIFPGSRTIRDAIKAKAE